MTTNPYTLKNTIIYQEGIVHLLGTVVSDDSSLAAVDRVFSSTATARSVSIEVASSALPMLYRRGTLSSRESLS